MCSLIPLLARMHLVNTLAGERSLSFNAARQSLGDCRGFTSCRSCYAGFSMKREVFIARDNPDPDPPPPPSPDPFPPPQPPLPDPQPPTPPVRPPIPNLRHTFTSAHAS